MEQNVLNHNSFSLGKSLAVTGLVAISGFTVASVLTGVVTKAYTPAPIYTYDNTQSSYGVLAVKITSDDSGVAVVNLNGFRVYTNYKFKTFQDSRGEIGSDFTAIDLYDLAIDRVLDANGNTYSEKIINKDDIRNMIAVIKAHIERNQMVKG